MPARLSLRQRGRIGLRKFDPSELRDEHGEWTAGGAVSRAFRGGKAWVNHAHLGEDGKYHLYHGTTADRAEQIKATGLHSPQGTGPGYLMLTTSKEQAAKYGHSYEAPSHSVVHFALTPEEAAKYLAKPEQHDVYGHEAQAHGLLHGELPPHLIAGIHDASGGVSKSDTPAVPARKITLRKRGYPQLVRAHVRGATIPSEVQAEVAHYLNQRPDIRACEAAEHGYDPAQDIPRYLAQELAEPEHATIRTADGLTVAAIKEWERQEDAEHADDGKHVMKADGEVYDALKKNYPADTIQWAKGVDWQKADVPLSDIQMARRPGGRDQAKVEGIAQAVNDGKQMDRVVLVKTPGNDRHEIADGYHRTLAFQHAGKKTIPAYVGKVDSDEGPWVRDMHDAKLNKSAFPVLVFRKDSPTATDVHVDVPIGSQPKKKRKKNTDDEPAISVIKADDEQRIVYGIVLEPDVEDSQGDVVSKADVELAAHRYVYQNIRPDIIGDQHGKMAPPSVRPVESFIAPCDFEMGGQPVKKGSWVLVGKIDDDSLWQQVKKGDKGAWSVGGTGKRSPL